MEFQLIRNSAVTRPESKLGWLFKIAISIIAVGYFLYRLQERNLPWNEITVYVIIALAVFLILFFMVKANQNKPCNSIKIQDNNLYITAKDATLWCKPIDEIIEITVVEPVTKWNIVTQPRSLIFKTQDDSYSLDLQYFKFNGYSCEDVVAKLKAICKL